MMEKLPPGIALEIFYRLPPESVVLCKLVCKFWWSLLPLGDDGNYFANMHLHRRRRNLDYSTLNFIALHEFTVEEGEGSRSAVGEFGITEYNEVEELNCKVKRLNFSQFFTRNGVTSLFGSCNGLVCMARTNYCTRILFYRICICNPLLHEYVTLPLSDLQLTYDRYTYYDIFIGFGHNPITDEYKVVRVQYRLSDSVMIGDVEVYTLGKNNGMWRNKGTIKYILLGGRLRPVHMNGSIHWLARSPEDQLQNIVSFDLEDEKFRVIPSPSYPHIIHKEVRELRGCLCLFQESREMDGSIDMILDIWVLKDYMNKESWVKEFSIKGVRRGLRSWYSPVAIKKKKKKDGDGDKILLLSNCNNKILVSYDPKTQNFENIVVGRQVVSVSMYDQEPLLYVNSLVSLKALGEDAKYAENHPKTKA